MSRQIKVLLAVFVVCLLAIVANLTWIQIFQAEELQTNEYNNRQQLAEYEVERGEIYTADGQLAAYSVDTGGEYRFQREYPMGSLMSDVIGYDSYRYGRTGLEKRYNKQLLGEGTALTYRSLANRLLETSPKGNSLVMTIDSRLQRTAAEALGGRNGAVVAMDPETGAVLAMATSPSYDPNLTIPVGDVEAKQAAWDALRQDPEKPLINRCIDDYYPPGSSFKVVTASAALDTNIVTPETTFDSPGELEIRGFKLHNFGNRSYGTITFEEAMIISSNTVFAQVGLRLGADLLVHYAQLYGFNEDIPFDLPVVKSTIEISERYGDPEVVLATASIGQTPDLATPLQMALVASGVANGGAVMEPYLVKEIRDYNGKVVEQYKAREWQRAIEPQTAETLTDMMVEVVDEGTGTAAQIPGVDVAGKTGTAEVAEGEPHAWFICFAPAYDPEIAVAVLIEHGGSGGRAAAPVAREVIEQALSL